ncbi:MAG: LysR family transcriptional regulator [Pseudomonadota bacterium]|nr:LysR family transcriptional regulator [Pseudomonadota bacterium]
MDRQRIHALLGHLHWLVALAQQGSYTAAAARLGVSKAAMSQHISELERIAGVALVQRTTRSVRLTEAGQRLVDETRPAFETIAESFESVREYGGTPRGLVRVSAPVALARQQLVPRLARFLHDNPEVRVELDLSDQLVSLAREGFDLAIRHSDVVPDTHVAWTLCTTHPVLVASPAYLAEHGEPARPEDLASHRCLHYPRGSEVPTWTLERGSSRAAEARRITVPVRGPLAATNSEALRDGALAHVGIALLPDFSAQAALNSGELLRVLPRWNVVGTFATQIRAIRPYSTRVPLAVAALVQHLRTSLADGFPLPERTR